MLNNDVSEFNESRCDNPILMFCPNDTENEVKQPEPTHRPVTNKNIEEWKWMAEHGWSIRAIARSENRSTETIWKYLQANDRIEKLADFKEKRIPPNHNKPFMG